MKVVYCSGPITLGNQEANVLQAILTAEKFIAMGLIPYVPHLSWFWGHLFYHDFDYWMRMDFEWISRCDCLFRIPGESKGGDMEVEHAKSLGKPVFYDMESIETWSKE